MVFVFGQRLAERGIDNHIGVIDARLNHRLQARRHARIYLHNLHHAVALILNKVEIGKALPAESAEHLPTQLDQRCLLNRDIAATATAILGIEALLMNHRRGIHPLLVHKNLHRDEFYGSDKDPPAEGAVHQGES